jgi:hypothetical protein
MKVNATFMRHFPDELLKGRLPQREYFFNIIYTGMTEYLQNLINHAIKQRHSAAA